MVTMPQTSTRRYRAPESDGTALIEPPAPQIASLVTANRAQAAQWATHGLPLADWRQQARGQLPALVAAHAERQTRAGVPPIAVPSASQWLAQPLIVTGHQPTWYHPGVWFKNFLTDQIARQLGGIALHLVVDNDVAGPATLAIPSGTTVQPQLVSLPLDRPSEGVPWEERPVLEPSLLATVAHRVREQFTLRPTHAGPLIVERMQPYLVALLDRATPQPPAGTQSDGHHGVRLGDCLAIARHGVEREAGLATFELNLSQLARTEPFGHFVDHLCRRAEELHQAYNEALAAYRVANRVRSRSHPVPALERDGPWIELPLWIYSAQRPHRRRAFVRLSGNAWQLSDRQGTNLAAEAYLAAVASGHDAMCEGDVVRVRPRALVTTLYARLMLGDLFVHGIGGAKYDEMTDALMARLWGIEPPGYVTATATFRLPLARPVAVGQPPARELARQIRDLTWHPERWVGDRRVQADPALADKVAALVAEKRAYVNTHRLRRCTAHEYAGFARIQAALQQLLAPLREALQAQYAQALAQEAQARWLASREFSLALFEDGLPSRLLALCPPLA